MDQYPFLNNEDELKKDPDTMIKIIKSLFIRVQTLEDELELIKSQNHDIQLINSKGGSRKGKTGMTWSKKEPDQILHNYVEKCISCGNIAAKTTQKISYSKRIMEMPSIANIILQEVHIHKFRCDKCGKITQAKGTTLKGTSLGPRFLAYLTNIRYMTCDSFENLAQVILVSTGVKPSQTSLNRGLAKVSEILVNYAEENARKVMNSDWISIYHTGLLSSGNKKNLGIWIYQSKDDVYFNLVLSNENTFSPLDFVKKHNNRIPIVIVENNEYNFNTVQLCWSNLINRIKYLDDKQLENDILDLYNLIGSISKDEFIMEYNKILGTKYSKNTIEIINHLRREMENYLRFLDHPGMPHSIDRAKEIITSVLFNKTKMRILRNKGMVRQYCTIINVLSNWDLKNIEIINSLTDIITKNTQQTILL